MASQGPNVAGTGGNNAGVGTVDWANIAGVSNTDGTSPTTFTASATGTISHYLTATNFGFTIPAGTINGVQVFVDASGQPTVFDESSVKLIKGGTVSGNEKSTGAGLDGSVTFNYGAVNDLWGITLAPSDVNASNFGVAFAAVKSIGLTEKVANAWNVRIIITYTPSGGAAPYIGNQFYQLLGVGI